MGQILVVGGGLAGLVAAIECAERGASVEMHEASPALGGRARSFSHDQFVTNWGPHALYQNGPGSGWLEKRGLMPAVVRPAPGFFRVRLKGRIQPPPPVFVDACRKLLDRPAPASQSFASWARTVVGEAAALVEGFLTLPTFDGDPGRHAAASVQATLARSLQPRAVTYVRGGWRRLVERLEARARELRVEIHQSSRVEPLPEQRPVIVSTGPAAAARLLKNPRLRPDGQRVALRDLGLIAMPNDDLGPDAVVDLDDGVYVARYSHFDKSLAPSNHELLQCCAGLRGGEDGADAHERIVRVLNAVVPGWQTRRVFDRASRSPSPGARDHVGAGWQQRPAVDYGEGILLAGDWVAGPGLLSDVCFTTAVAAAERATTGRKTSRAAAG